MRLLSFVRVLSAHPGIQPQFYNPSKLDVTGNAVPISWPAFPHMVELSFGDDTRRMFEEGDERDNQDEYLEWSVVKQNDKMIRVMFTCEGPEYWDFIAQNDPNLLVRLYSTIVGQPVPRRDLLAANGTYRRRNRWNMEHAVHLVQPNNTLGAEINIAAQATVLRRGQGQDPITDPDLLIDCARFGVKQRHSDPHIGEVVNQQARAGSSVTLQDPVGLYIESLPEPDELDWRKPDGTRVGNYWRVERQRGDRNNIVRAVYEVPDGELSGGVPFVVGDILIEGDRIEFGGQMVKGFLNIRLTGVIGRAGVFHNRTFPCRGASPFSPLDANPFSRGVGGA